MRLRAMGDGECFLFLICSVDALRLFRVTGDAFERLLSLRVIGCADRFRVVGDALEGEREFEALLEISS